MIYESAGLKSFMTPEGLVYLFYQLLRSHQTKPVMTATHVKGHGGRHRPQQVSRRPWWYLRAVPGPSHHNDELLVEVDRLPEPPVVGSVELQQQTVPTAGHGHVGRSQHGFGGTDHPIIVLA